MTIARSAEGVVGVEDELWIDPRDRGQDNEIRGVALQLLMSNGEVPDERIDVAVAHQRDSTAAFQTVSRLAGVGGISHEIKVITAGLGG